MVSNVYLLYSTIIYVHISRVSSDKDSRLDILWASHEIRAIEETPINIYILLYTQRRETINIIIKCQVN